VTPLKFPPPRGAGPVDGRRNHLESGVMSRYGVPTHDYDAYDELLDSGKIDAVYIGLPNHLHCDYAVRAAKRGVHVLCEKPMALDESECEKMMRAADDGGVKLMVAYRLRRRPRARRHRGPDRRAHRPHGPPVRPRGQAHAAAAPCGTASAPSPPRPSCARASTILQRRSKPRPPTEPD